MANMTFKTNLLPNSDLGYSLGSSDQRWKINDLAGGPIEYIVDTKTGTSSAWTGVTKDSTLAIGKVIAFKVTNAPSGNASLLLTFTNPPEGEATATAAIPVYLNNTRVTTHYANGSVILMVYDGTNWRSTDYWNSNSRDAGYGKITPLLSDAETAITPNTTQLVSTTYTEAMKVAAGNKWVQFAGTNGGTGTDVLTVGHSLSGITAGNYGDSSAQTPSYGGTFNVPYISVDAAGHITGISTHTVKIPASDNTTYTFNDGTAGNFTVTPSGGTALTVSIGKPATAGTADKATADASGNTITTTYLTKASGVTAVTWDSTNKKITRTINGSAADVVLFAAGSNITLTGASGKLTIASTDTNNAVTLAETTTNSDYRLLLSSSADTATTTAGAGKSTNLRFNPSTKLLSIGGSVTATGDLTLTGNANLNSETYADSLTAGSLLVTGAAAFTNIPTAPTPATTSNDTSIATTAFVMNAFTANDAMVFKGVINANSGLPANHKQGWTYRIGTAGTYANKVCEVGDIIICVTDGTAANNDHWAVIQNNIDGAVYKGANAFTDAHVIIADSTAGKVKDSGKTITATAPSSSAADTTIPTSKAVWSAISGASGYGKTGTVTSVLVLASSPLLSSVNTAQSTSLNTTISFTNQNVNTILAGPSSGSAAAAPTFRALVAADIPTITKSKISDFPTSMTPTSHTHGNITNDGKITTTATIASGDKIVIVDSDTTAASKITSSSITFGTSANYALANDGTWQAFTNITYSSTTPKALGTASVGSENAVARGDHVHPKPTPADIGAAAASHGTHVTYSSTTPKALGTASVGSENAVARGDHVHPKPSLNDLGAASSTHTHGNITNDGKIGSTANYAVYTTTSGAVTATSFVVASPDPNGDATSFIDSVSQDSKGLISATKKTIPSATTSTAGIIQIGTGASNAAAGNHTHTTTLATDSGTSTVTLAHGSKYKLTAGGTSVIFTMPASGNTDTKQNIVLATTTKAYLTGVTTAPTSTTAAMTGVGDTGVYLTSTAGELSAVRHSFNSAGSEKAYISYNTTTNALDFVFV